MDKNKFATLIQSRKFWASAGAIAAVMGLDISSELQAVIIAGVVIAYEIIIAAEKIAAMRNGQK